MITITNSKVAGLEPRWAPFRGLSLLFDNPGENFRRTGDELHIDCRAHDDATLQLFGALMESAHDADLDHLLKASSFCPLPSYSYHVTVWDCINDANISNVSEERRTECKHLLQQLPGSLRGPCPFPEIAESALITNQSWDIQFAFDGLENWSDISIVARLAPADAESSAHLCRLTEARARLSDAFARRYGVRPTDIYVPHVTLGYFANASLAHRATDAMNRWSERARSAAQGLTLPFQAVSLYGFIDMATFFKPAPGRTHP